VTPRKTSTLHKEKEYQSTLLDVSTSEQNKKNNKMEKEYQSAFLP